MTVKPLLWKCSECGKVWSWELIRNEFYDWYRCPAHVEGELEVRCGGLVYEIEGTDESKQEHEKAAPEC